MVTAWAASRSAPAFTRGLPAMMVGGGFLMALVLASFLLETNRINSYQQRFAHELGISDNPEMATGFAEKLIGLSPEDDLNRFRLGIAKYADDDVLGAVDVMQYLAVEKNNPLAQVWLGETILNTDPLDLSVEDGAEQAIRYYTSAIANLDKEEDIEDYTKANLGLAESYKRKSLFAPTEKAREIALEKAITQLDTVVNGKIIYPGQLDAIPILIKYYQENGQLTRAKNQLRLSMKNVGPLARRLPDEFRIWSNLVQSCVVVDDFEYAEEIIREGLQLATKNETRAKIRGLLSQVLIRKADFIKDLSNERNYRLRLEIISQAIVAEPTLITGYERLLEFVAPEDESTNHESWLRRSVIGSRAPGIAHIVMGMRALDRRESLQGQRHWKIASQQALHAQHIINLLINYSHKHAPDRFTNLVDIASVAIESFPSHFPLYVTRGSIYLSEEKYDEALKDLNIAVQKFPESIIVHEALATVYTKLDQPEKAQEHQELAADFKLQQEMKSTELLEERE